MPAEQPLNLPDIDLSMLVKTDLPDRIVLTQIDTEQRRASAVGEHLTDAERKSLWCYCLRLGDTWHHARFCPVPDVERIKADAYSAGVAAGRAEALAEAAGWIAQFGYPIQVGMPDLPPPAALWDALVDVVHKDATGEWHGNELDRDETDSWLREEAGLGGDQ